MSTIFFKKRHTRAKFILLHKDAPFILFILYALFFQKLLFALANEHESHYRRRDNYEQKAPESDERKQEKF